MFARVRYIMNEKMVVREVTEEELLKCMRHYGDDLHISIL